MFEFIFGEKKEKENKNSKFVKIIDKKQIKLVYLVIDKNSMHPLGVFDNLENAKINGQKITYYNCMIIPFNINESCKYLIEPIFESK
jgi:hypothetical protein